MSWLMVTSAWAQSGNGLDALLQQEPEFLPVEQAFAFDYEQKGNQLLVTFNVAPGYYLYKHQFKTVVKNAELGEPVFPPADSKEDEYFGVTEVYHAPVTITWPIKQSIQDGVVKLRFQGCAEAGLCYPPTTQVIYLEAVAATQSDTTGVSEPSSTVMNVAENAPASQQFELQSLLQKDNLALALLVFLGLGVGLAFTPCVFPMYPILSGIVIGQGKNISLARAFSLSFVYVQGMAITYSLMGLAVASAGVQFQAALQHPAILWALIGIFVVLALAMFGAWELQLPSAWAEKLNGISNNQTRGSFIGVFIMGALSGLVASPCTTAPLTGILLFIAQSGDLLLGFSALYVLSLGMGIPLILFGMTGGKLLPKAGAWMNIVKTTFGFMLLLVALIFIERLYQGLWVELAWAVLGLAAFSYYQVMNQNSQLSFMKGVRGLLIFVGLFTSAWYGAAQLGWLTGQQSQHTSAEAQHPDFLLVKDLEDFQNKLASAGAGGKSVMVDLYADWCVACKEFEKYTFPDPQVIQALHNTVWMQIDLTDNTPQNLAFQEYFHVLGLPTILFFDKQGNELKNARVTGFLSADAFSKHVSHHLP